MPTIRPINIPAIPLNKKPIMTEIIIIKSIIFYFLFPPIV
jgi:hypothetical protein